MSQTISGKVLKLSFQAKWFSWPSFYNLIIVCWFKTTSLTKIDKIVKLKYNIKILNFPFLKAALGVYKYNCLQKSNSFLKGPRTQKFALPCSIVSFKAAKNRIKISFFQQFHPWANFCRPKLLIDPLLIMSKCLPTRGLLLNWNFWKTKFLFFSFSFIIFSAPYLKFWKAFSKFSLSHSFKFSYF